METRLENRHSDTLSDETGPRTAGLGPWTLPRAFVLGASILATAAYGQTSPPLQKFVDPLPKPSVMAWDSKSPTLTRYTVDMRQATQKLHRDIPATTIWGYEGIYPGPTFETRYGERIEVTWTNSLPTTHLFRIDYTLHDTEHGEPDVRTVVHRHGGLQFGQFDGSPDAWFTPGQAEFGTMAPPNYRTYVYTFDNLQDPTTLWYHDHAVPSATDSAS